MVFHAASFAIELENLLEEKRQEEHKNRASIDGQFGRGFSNGYTVALWETIEILRKFQTTGYLDKEA